MISKVLPQCYDGISGRQLAPCVLLRCVVNRRCIQHFTLRCHILAGPLKISVTNLHYLKWLKQAYIDNYFKRRRWSIDLQIFIHLGSVHCIALIPTALAGRYCNRPCLSVRLFPFYFLKTDWFPILLSHVWGHEYRSRGIRHRPITLTVGIKAMHTVHILYQSLRLSITVDQFVF